MKKIIIILLSVFFINTLIAQIKPDGSEVTKVCNQAFEDEVIRLVNIERKSLGLNALQKDNELVRSARYHAWDMATHEFYDHASLKKNSTGKWDVVYFKSSERIRKFLSKKPRCTAENIAAGQRTPKQVMEKWMNSSGHKANILNPDFTHIGVGYYKPEVKRYRFPHYWVQNFRCEGF